MQDTEYARQHARLAERLRALRRASGISGVTLAKQVCLSQTAISRAEAGLTTPKAALVDSWCTATGADKETRHELLDLAKSLATQFNSRRTSRRRGFGTHQSEISLLEARAESIRIYQQAIIPGLLQTAEYARQMFCRLLIPPSDIGAAVAARLDRQGVLYDQQTKLEFVICESALRRRICGERTLRVQWDRLLQIATLPNVDLRVLANDADVTMVPATTFVMFGEEIVLVETLTAETLVRDARDIEGYAKNFAVLQNCALHPDQSIAFIRHLLDASSAMEVSGHPRTFAEHTAPR